MLINPIGISIPFVLLITTEELSTGAIAVNVALRTPNFFILILRGSQSNVGVKSVSSLDPAARNSQGNIPFPYRVLALSTQGPRSLASSTVASVR